MKRWQELEQAVERYLTGLKISYLHIKNYRCFKCGQVQNSEATGWPDFFCYYPIQLAIECKTGSGKLTPAQEVTKQKLIASGVPYIELRDTVDELINYISNFKQGGRRHGNNSRTKKNPAEGVGVKVSN